MKKNLNVCKAFSVFSLIVMLMVLQVSVSLADCISNPPTVYVSPDQTTYLCLPNISFDISGTIGGSATACIWTSSGTGTFASATSANTTYYPSNMERQSGAPITLTLTATGNGCEPVSRSLVIRFLLYTPTTAPGPNQTVCSNVSFVQLAGQSIASGYRWTTKGTGTGTFSPNNTMLNARYIPSAADIANGTVQLTLIVPASDPCELAQAMTITFVKVTSSPTDRNICENGSTTFSTAITSGYTGTVTYQWQVDKGPGFANVTDLTNEYSGSTTATLTLKPNVATAAYNAYRYRCVVSLCSTSYNTNAARLTVRSNSLFVADPLDQSTCAGGSATFTSFSVPSAPGVIYQWAVDNGSGIFGNLGNGANVNGATTNVLTLSNVTAVMQGYRYRLTANNGCTVQHSVPRSVTVSNLTFSTQPQASSSCEGASASFAVTVSGDMVTSFQWQEDRGSGFENLSDDLVYQGSNTGNLSISAATSAMNNYQYRCLVKSTCSPSGKLSDAATLQVSSGVTLLEQPEATSTCEGGSAEFSVSAAGSGLAYQWQVANGSAFDDLEENETYTHVNSATLHITAATELLDELTYRVVVTHVCNEQTSAAAALTVFPALAITGQPAGITAWNGGGVSFTCTATGSNLTYRWQSKGFTDTDFLDLYDGVYYTINANVLTLSETTPDMNGTLFRCVIGSYDCDLSLITNEAELTIESISLCMVTTNEEGKNLLIFEKPTQLSGVESFQLFRYNTTSETYELIGSINKTEMPTFVDEEADPANASYVYQVSVKDVNANNFPVNEGASFRTIYLNVTQGSGQAMELNWNSYDDNTSNTYNIYRGLSAEAMNLIGSVENNGTSYTDNSAPVAAQVFYQIELTLPSSCNPVARTSSYASTKSNRVEANTLITGRDEAAVFHSFTLYPNPARETVTLKGLPEGSTVTVVDLNGSPLKTVHTSASSVSVPVHELSKGLYLIEVRNNQAVIRRSLVIE